MSLKIIKAGYWYKDLNSLRRIVLMDDRETTKRKGKMRNIIILLRKIGSIKYFIEPKNLQQ